MTQKNVFIHIGQYKTGTSSLQRFLFENRQVLKNHGFIYPDKYMRENAHYLLNECLRDEYRGKRKKDKYEDILCEVSDGESIIISCEDFSAATVSKFYEKETIYVWQRLLEIFKDYKVYIIVYIRRQDDAIESRMIQQIKSKSASRGPLLDEYLHNDTSLDYYHFLDILVKIYGESSVIYKIYNVKRLAESDIRRDFLNCIKLFDKKDFIFGKELQNVTPSGKYVEIMRLLNANNIPVDQRRKLSGVAWHKWCGNDEQKAVYLNVDEKQKIMKWFEKSNLCLIEKYFHSEIGPGIREFFFSPKEVIKNCIVSNDDIVSIMCDCIAR